MKHLKQDEFMKPTCEMSNNTRIRVRLADKTEVRPRRPTRLSGRVTGVLSVPVFRECELALVRRFPNYGRRLAGGSLMTRR